MGFLTAATVLVLSLLSPSSAQQDGANSTFDPARPPAIPLAVKSPYLSCWQEAGSDGGNGGYLAGQWPSFWSGTILGWTGMVRVDDNIYTWMGAPNISGTVVPPVVNQTAFSYTSTRSVFQMDVAGTIDMTITFLSAVYPNDYMRQSFPISFMDVSVESKDGAEHNVQVYTDITAEWVSGDRSAIAQWDYSVIGSQPCDGPCQSDPNLPTSFNLSTPASPSTSSSSVTSSDDSAATTTTSDGSESSEASDASSTEAPTTTAAPQRRDALVEQLLEARQFGGPRGGFGGRGGPGGPGDHQVYGSRTDFVNIDYATHYTRPFVPKTSDYINPHPRPSATAQAPSSPVCTKPTPTETGGIAYHKVYRQTQLAFSEIGDQTEYGYWYYVTNNSINLTYQQGIDDEVRSVFLANGFLNNTQDTNYRAINDSYPVFGYSYDFGTVTTRQNNVWAIALSQEQAVQFDGAQGNQTLKSLWTETHSSDEDALQFYFTDYPNAVSISDALDSQIESDSTADGGENYSLLTTLAVRQAFGTIEFTNTAEDPLIFMKEISSDGNVNTVDVIYPFHPIAIYLNPQILKNLLDPLFINQENFHWPFAYSIHDIGSHFPNATGHDDGMAEMQPLEECGNMIIMSLAYAQRSGDTGYLQQHYSILRQWNDYLVNDSLIPQNQISTDDFAGALENQTDLAVKGIIGIQAMAVISNLTGNFADGANYTSIAQSYISQWQTLGNAAGANPPHTSLNYGNDSTYGLLYNIFADKELGLGLVPQQIFDQQSAFYPTVLDTYGVPLDSRGNYTKNDWEIFCAAVASAETKAAFIDAIALWVGQTPTNLPLTDLYYVESGDYPLIGNATLVFTARPAVGGYFAPLALRSAPPAPVSIPGPDSGTSNSTSKARRWMRFDRRDVL